MDNAVQNFPLGSNPRVGPMGFLLWILQHSCGKTHRSTVVLNAIEGIETASDQGAVI
jgi:hypothetical protein